MSSGRIVYSCLDDGADLEDDEYGWWCPSCETLWSALDLDPPEYQHPEDDDEWFNHAW